MSGKESRGLLVARTRLDAANRMLDTILALCREADATAFAAAGREDKPDYGSIDEEGESLREAIRQYCDELDMLIREAR
ncbi:hypothetical protein [Bifidobacterium felsineum]|uniref:hypothetical protein n=1 Tax=Bifidobacterium felsineum TaxID=2045440 RepID=UPI001BDC0385|nr:hypothetical protein [Bifidobacterium felsineum]MBT1164647.1 hypothetical protein [Bifidobacterium felsineum]